MSHTNAPWRRVVDIEGHPTKYRVMDANDDNVCVPCYGHDQRSITEANANLIAAAPDLLAALTQCVRAIKYTSGVSFEFAVKEAEAAILKAEGQS